MEEFEPLQIYAAVAGIRYVAGLAAGAIASYSERKAAENGTTSNARWNYALFTGMMDGMRIPLEIILAGENANPAESGARLSLEYLSNLAGFYTPKLLQKIKR